MMRIVFMGTPEFAVPVLEKLKQSGLEIVAVVTQPDRPRGRGRKVSFSPVKAKALELGLEVLQPLRVKEEAFIQQIQELQPDLIIVAAFGQILPEKILKIPPLGCLNVHASLLPHYRGAAPIQRALMNGEKKTGVTIMLMEKGLDTGDMLAQAEVTITAELNFGQLHDRLALAGAELLMNTLPAWREGKITPVAQVDKEASYAAPLTRKDELICWANSAQLIYNQIRSLAPWPGAYTIFQGKPLKIWESEFVCVQAEKVAEKEQAVPGTVLSLVKGRGFVVQTGEGGLLIKQVQPVGKKIIPAQSFINGYRLEVGNVFNNAGNE
jgi:methionyl-tRNA formyltransferase